MGGFSKLFSSILESTVWLESPETKVVWITMIALADRFGNVDASVPGLAGRAGVSIKQCKEALRIFLSPDPHSRTAIMAGRRIEEVDGGWRLINYEKYRGMQGDGEPAPELDESGRSSVKVYFIQCGRAIKIGSSRNPWARLTQLKTGMPEAPRLLGHFNAPMSREKELHKQFAAHRINGEWFRDCDEIRAAIVALCTTTGSEAVATEVATKVALPSYKQRQIPDTEGKKKRAPRKTAIPEGFGISERVRAWAKEKGHSLLEERLEHFIGYAKRSGRVYADWDAAFECAVREDWAKLNGRGSAAGHAGTLGAEETT